MTSGNVAGSSEQVDNIYFAIVDRLATEAIVCVTIRAHSWVASREISERLGIMSLRLWTFMVIP
jgi:hypothetical protein